MHDNWTPLCDTHPALTVLKDCVQRLDPTRLWLPTSGSGPCANADVGKVGQMLHATYHSKSYRDWVVWKMHELFRRQPFGGWYYDVVSPVSSAWTC